MMMQWTGGRRPLAEPEAEARRTAAYREWLSSSGSELADSAAYEAYAGGGGRWVRLGTAADADWEALHMQHSIGHSWDKYSAYGDIYSLRSADRLPQATVLVAGGVVVHAREHANARLSAEHQAELEAFAASMGWTIQPDALPFDVLRDAGAPNTRITYLLRKPSGDKAFGEETVEGSLADGDVDEIAAALGSGCFLDPAWFGAPALGTGQHVLMSVRDVCEAATLPLDAATFRATIVAASRNAAPSAVLG